MGLANLVSEWAIPALLVIIPVYGFGRGVPVYEAFVAGAEEGLRVAVRILPYMLGILIALGIFRHSGALDVVARWARPITAAFGFPVEVLPLMVIRPLSGSGALAAVMDLIRIHGPDSFIGRLGAVMQGSTDTTFYVLSVYFGSVGVNRSRYALIPGLIGDFMGFVAALWATLWFWG